MELRDQLKDIESALSSQYGPPTNRYDELEAGSVWTEPGDWTMGLVKKKRTDETFWMPVRSSGCVVNAAVEVIGENRYRGYLSILFELKGYDTAVKLEEERINSALGTH
jgi:hypothetical protein